MIIPKNQSAELITDCKSAELVKIIVVNSGDNPASITWNNVSSNTNIFFNNGYICNNDISRIILTLPSFNGANGNVIIFKNSGIAGFRIQQNSSNQQITVGNKKTTLGISGAIESFDIGDYIRIERILGEWVATELIGNIEVI